MIKQTSLLLLALSALSAAPSLETFRASSSSQSILYFRAGTDGAENNEMILTYSNPTSVNAKVRFEVYNSAGTLLEVPYIAEGGGITRLRQVDMELAPLAAGVVKTSSAGTRLQRGWLRVVSEPAGAVSVVAHGWTSVNNAPFRLMFALRPAANAKVQLVGPFTNGSRDQFLIANNSTATDQVTLVARTRAGEEMCRASLQMGANEYYKQPLRNYLPCTADISATLEIQSQTGSSSAMVFMLPPSGEVIPLEGQPVTRNAAQSFEQALQEFYNNIRKRAGF